MMTCMHLAGERVHCLVDPRKSWTVRTTIRTSPERYATEFVSSLAACQLHCVSPADATGSA